MLSRARHASGATRRRVLAGVVSADRVVGASAVQGRARSGSGGADSRTPEPPIPDDADPRLLDSSVRAELKTLSKPNAQAVAGHLVAAGHLIDADPVRALAHARAARGRAARVAAVREATGVAAYHAGEWAEALSELRTARRIRGDPRDIAMIADCERALGRPEQAVRMLNDPDARRLDPETFAELLIVVAGARRDLGQLDSALTVLARGGLDRARPRPGAMRLWYAYADAPRRGREGRRGSAVVRRLGRTRCLRRDGRRGEGCRPALTSRGTISGYHRRVIHRRRQYPQIAVMSLVALTDRRRYDHAGHQAHQR